MLLASAGDWTVAVAFFVAMAAIIVLFVGWAVRHSFRFVQVGFQYDESPEDALRDWVGYYAGWLGSHGFTMSSHGLNTVTYSRRHFPRWSVIVAVLFFPLGLLALLARATANLVVTAAEEPTGTYVAVSGEVPRLVAKSLTLDATNEARLHDDAQQRDG
jgi:apolipoprotein N-acyltransferase